MASIHASARLRATACAVAAGLALTAALVPAAHAEVSPAPTKTAGLGGEAVYDLAVLPSGRVILGGKLTSIGSFARSNLAATLASGKADPNFAPTVNGPVAAVAATPDGSRVFIGGTFTEVNGVPRQNLAALDAVTGALVEDWQADTTGTLPNVSTLTVSGTRLLVGGKFTGIDGTAKQKLAAIDVTTGNALTWNTWINGAVNEVRVAPDGTTVWIGGEFTKIRGIDRPYFGALDIVTGLPTDYNPTGNGSRLISLAISPDGQWIYTTNNANRTHGYQPAVSTTPRWTRITDGNVQAMAASDTTLYIGGHYASFSDDGTVRNFFASADRFTGVLTTWDPLATGSNKGCWALVIEGTHLHAGGGFTHFNGVQQRLYARFDGTP